MKKKKTQKETFDVPRTGRIVKFVRQKRLITQKELSSRCAVSQSALSFLEAGSPKVSKNNVERVLGALSINRLLLSEKGLLDALAGSNLLSDLKKDLGFPADSVLKVYCSIFDAYSAMLPPTVISRIQKMSGRIPDERSFYLLPVIIVELLHSLAYSDVREIFSPRISMDFAEGNKESYEDALLKNAIVFKDPFLIFAERAKIPYANYFATLAQIALTFDNLKFAPLHGFDAAIQDLMNTLNDYMADIRKKLL